MVSIPRNVPEIAYPKGSTTAEKVAHVKGMTHLSKNIRNKMINTLLEAERVFGHTKVT